jgi:hypothetical protein
MTSYTWSGVTGDWNSTNWSPSGAPTASDAASLSAAGAYTVTVDSPDVASSLTLSDASAVLQIASSGSLTIGGAFSFTGGALDVSGTLALSGTLTETGGAFNLYSGGVISGGALDLTGGAISWSGGALSGVKVWGPLNLTTIGATVHLSNGTSVVGASGSGAGIINATGSGAELYLDTAQTVSDDTINIGYGANGLNYLQFVAGGAAYAFASTTTTDVVGRSEFNFQGVGTTTTNHGAINVDSGVLQITGDGLWNNTDTFVNSGSMTINTGGGFLTELSNFTNGGAFTVNTGGAATIDPTTFTTTASSVISVATGATLTINAHASWSNLGSITLNSGSTLLIEDDAVTAAALGKIANAGALEIGAGAAYNNAGATLNGTAAPGVLTLEGGAISGGTVTSAGVAFSAKGGSLAGVTVDGPITLGASQILSLGTGTQFLGASGAGAGVVNVTGNAAYLNLSTDTAVSDETINLGNSSNALAYVELNVAGSNYALGATATINVLGSADIDYDKTSNALTNQGQINVNSGGLDIVGYSTSGYTDAFTNSGALNLASGVALYMLNMTNVVNSGQIASAGDEQMTLAATTFTNNGSISTGSFGTLTIDPTTFAEGASGSINVGTYSDAYVEPSSAWTNFASNTLTGGSYAVAAGAMFEAYSASTFATLAASVTLNGSGSAFDAYNSNTGATTAIDTSLTAISSTGAFSLLGGRGWTTAGAAISNSGVITLGGGTITATATGASLTDASGSRLVGSGTVTATSFANSGVIEASGGTLTISNALTGSGALQIDASADLVVGGAVASGASAIFNGANATLTLKAPSTFSATLGALGAGDAIDLVGVTANSATVSGGKLVVAENGTTVATFALNSAAAALAYSTSAVSGGTDIVLAPQTVTVSQYMAAVATYDASPSGVAIADTAANVGANLASLVDSHIVSIASTSGVPTVSVSSASAYKSTLDKITGGYAISDTAANLSPALSTLTDAKISKMTVSDGGVITVTAAELGADELEINKLVTTSGATYGVAVSDTAANILSGAAPLQAEAAHISTITSTSGVVTATAAIAKADATGLNKIVGGFAVTDTAANIASNIAAIAADASIATLSATSGSGTLSGVSSIAAKTFALSGSGTAVTIGASLTDAGAFKLASGSTLSISSGDTFTIDGAATLSGAVSGSGALATIGGTAATGATLSVSKWTSSSEAITVGSALTYAGALTAGAGDTLNLSGGALTLSGATTFTGGVTIAGSKALTLSGATTVAGALNLGGTGGVTLGATLTDSAGNATLGDSSGDKETLSIGSAGVFDFTDDHNLLLGTSASSSISNAGVIEKTGGTAISNIASAIANTGTIKAAAATLELSGAVTGTGSETISGASTLEFAGSAASTQTVSFTGTGGALELLSPTTFSAKISDFDLGGASGDSLILGSGWTYSSFVENSGSTAGTMTLVDGSSTATLHFSGAYTAATFAHTTNASGQTVVTY